MANQVINHKCPSCDAGLRFDGEAGKLVCDYCGNVYGLDEVEAMDTEDGVQVQQEAKASESQWDTSEFQTWDEQEKMKAYACPSCGAEIICDETTAATSCPYCGNPTIMPEKFAGGLRPNYIIPFKLDNKAAEKALSNYYKGKKFLPDNFATDNKIKEIKGVYVPFWFFDGAVEADVFFRAERRSRYRQGDYEVTKTDHFAVRRAGKVSFEKIPVDASTKMPNAHMDAIEPFDYRELKEFSSGYLPGFLADKYDITSENSIQRADERAVNSAIAAMRSDVIGYTSCMMENKRVRLHRKKVHYAWLPVYLLGTVWEGKQYLFAMNGQTGKFIGNLPIDKKKYWKCFGTITACVTAILGTLMYIIL